MLHRSEQEVRELKLTTKLLVVQQPMTPTQAKLTINPSRKKVQ
ncbi:hypothetical protein [Nostoc sp.]